MHEGNPPLNAVAHFAINADDVERARGFYERVFGWRFGSFGVPDFYTVDAGTPGATGPFGAVQKRRELIAGKPTFGFECSIAVADLAATIEAVRASGGAVVMERVTIPTVGDVAYFADTEGNVFGACEYLPRGDVT